MTIKEILLTPGPTHVPPAVLQAMNQPTLHHRTETFKRYFRQATESLKELLRTDNDPIFIAGSGTAAMEASLLNTCAKGDHILYINAGKFGERWGDIAERLSLIASEFRVKWGDPLNTEELSEFLNKHKDTKCVCLQYCETSTAAELPIEKIAIQIRKVAPNALIIVDAISAVGTRPIYPNKQNIDILVGAGHKGLMLPPGLAFVVLSQAAWNRADSIKVPSLYFDLKIERAQAKQSTTAWTPAMNHIVGLSASLTQIKNEGEDNVYERHRILSNATKTAIKALGLKVYSSQSPSNAVTAAVMPDGIDGELVRKIMREKWNVRIAGGQEELKGKIVRFGHMGYVSPSDILAGISAFESSLLTLTPSALMDKLVNSAGTNAAATVFRESMQG